MPKARNILENSSDLIMSKVRLLCVLGKRPLSDEMAKAVLGHYVWNRGYLIMTTGIRVGIKSMSFFYQLWRP